MRYQKSKSNQSKKVLLTILAIVVVLACVGTYIYHSRNTSKPISSTQADDKIDYSPGTKDDNQASDDRKDNPAPSPTLNNGTTPTPAPTTPGASTFSVQLTGANVQSGNVHIGTLVSGTTTGNCVLTATRDGQTTLQLATATVHQDVNAYSCGVFNVPTTKFTAPGTWKLVLTVTNGAESNTGTYDVVIP